MNQLTAGAAIVDITPDAEMIARGLPLAGFAARSAMAAGIHDPLSARAVAVNDTAIVVADIIAIDAAMSARIRARCVLPTGRVIVATTHTHGAPFSVPGRLGGTPDPIFLQRIEDGCVAAIDEAVANRCPATISAGTGADPGVARNRRHPGGPVDGAVPILCIADENGATISVVVSYACHPVVLGADNLLITADFPGPVRRHLEAAYPGAIALYLTGCCGDANTGHSAAASLSLAADDSRSFAAAERYGTRIANAALAACFSATSGATRAEEIFVTLDLARREADPQALRVAWLLEALTAEPVRRRLLEQWIAWAETTACTGQTAWTERVSVLHWAGVPVVAMPGEIFARTALDLRSAIEGTAFVLAYADSVPGYIPPTEEYVIGGYEVDEAHRFYGMSATFAPGSAERLADAVRPFVQSEFPR